MGDDLAKRVRTLMRTCCMSCARRESCPNYMNEAYWWKRYTQLDANNEMAKVRCSDYIHIMFKAELHAHGDHLHFALPVAPG